MQQKTKRVTESGSASERSGTKCGSERRAAGQTTLRHADGQGRSADQISQLFFGSRAARAGCSGCELGIRNEGADSARENRYDERVERSSAPLSSDFLAMHDASNDADRWLF